MFEDEIVAEVRKARDAYAAKFDYDIHRIVKDVQQRQARSGKKIVRKSAGAKQKVAKPRRTEKK